MKDCESKFSELGLKYADVLAENEILKEELSFAKTGDLYSPNVKKILQLSDEKKALLECLELFTELKILEDYGFCDKAKALINKYKNISG